MARTQRPPWWPLFIAVERALGEPLERATRSDEFADVVTRAAGIGAKLRKSYEKVTADVLHRYNLPAWSDVRLLTDQLTGLERRVADLGLELERRGERKTRPRSSHRRPRSSAR